MPLIDFDGASLPQLAEWFESDEANTRADAACALGDRLRTQELPGLETSLREKLAKLINDPVRIVQLEAAIALAEVGDRRATPVLLTAIQFRQYRLDAIRALGTLGDPATLDPLRHIMRKFFMPWADRLQAAAALCALNDAEGAQTLMERVNSRRRDERAAAVHFLGESRHPNALDRLTAIVEDRSNPLRDTAIRALGLLGDVRARVPLERALSDADHDELRHDIENSLRQLERNANRREPR